MTRRDRFRAREAPPAVVAGGMVAFCTVPHQGGIYAVYRRLRHALSGRGWRVHGVHVGREHRDWYGYDPGLADEGVIALAPDEEDLRACARALVEWVAAGGVDVVMPMSSPIALAAVPHLPPRVHVVTRCVDVTPFAYRLATADLARTSAVVATSPRQLRDLGRGYGVPGDKLVMIPNAVDVSAFRRRRDDGDRGTGPLRLAFLDRIEDRQKGVFLLPRLLTALDARGVAVRLDVIGGGPDLGALAEHLSPWVRAGRATLHGAQAGDRIPDLLRGADVLVKPTRFEGFPSALIEAMAAGVVPVCSRIRGVTDWIVDDGRTGLLCPIDRVAAFADAVERLARDRDLLARMAAAAAGSVAERFDLEAFGRRWDALFSRLKASEPPATATAARPWSAFRPSPAFDPPLSNRLLYRWLPRRLKDAVRARIEAARSRASGPRTCA